MAATVGENPIILDATEGDFIFGPVHVVSLKVVTGSGASLGVCELVADDEIAGSGQLVWAGMLGPNAQASTEILGVFQGITFRASPDDVKAYIYVSSSRKVC